MKIFHLQESLEQRSISRRSGHFTFLLLFEDWDYVDEVNRVTEGLLCERVCWIGPNGSCYSTTALLVHGDGER